MLLPGLQAALPKRHEATLHSGPTLSSILWPATSKGVRPSRKVTKLKSFDHGLVNQWLGHWLGAQEGGAPTALT